MEIKLQRDEYLKERRAKVLDVWRQIVSEYNDNVKIPEIMSRHISPETGKPYARSTIYGILRKMRAID